MPAGLLTTTKSGCEKTMGIVVVVKKTPLGKQKNTKI
jgi:hypothetical protein